VQHLLVEIGTCHISAHSERESEGALQSVNMACTYDFSIHFNIGRARFVCLTLSFSIKHRLPVFSWWKTTTSQYGRTGWSACHVPSSPYSEKRWKYQCVPENWTCEVFWARWRSAAARGTWHRRPCPCFTLGRWEDDVRPALMTSTCVSEKYIYVVDLRFMCNVRRILRIVGDSVVLFFFSFLSFFFILYGAPAMSLTW